MAETTETARRDQLTAEHEHLMTQLSAIGRAPRDEASGSPADREGGELDFDEGFADEVVVDDGLELGGERGGEEFGAGGFYGAVEVFGDDENVHG